METPTLLTPQYVTDADGRRTGVLLSLDAYEALMEDLAGRAAGDTSESAWLAVARRGGAFEDLADPAEDLYSETDGVPFRLAKQDGDHSSA